VTVSFFLAQNMHLHVFCGAQSNEQERSFTDLEGRLAAAVVRGIGGGDAHLRPDE
jgi:hypothetical protein